MDLKVFRARIANELWGSSCYQDLIKELRQRRPRIPQWDTTNDNTAKIQEALAQRKWHDLVMAIIDLNHQQEKLDE